jgi:hypothetical protein
LVAKILFHINTAHNFKIPNHKYHPVCKIKSLSTVFAVKMGKDKIGKNNTKAIKLYKKILSLQFAG